MQRALGYKGVCYFRRDSAERILVSSACYAMGDLSCPAVVGIIVSERNSRSLRKPSYAASPWEIVL